MAPALTLVILGTAYNYFGNTSLSENQLETVPRVPPIQRGDYNYTPGIGVHKVHSLAAKWYDARSICKTEGGDLVVINSKAEAELVVWLLAASGPHTGTSAPQWTFIGFHDYFREGQYEAVNGQSLSDGLYNEWISGEPNGGTKENCGTISTREGKLNDAQCDEPYGFVCELPNPDQGSLTIR